MEHKYLVMRQKEWCALVPNNSGLGADIKRSLLFVRVVILVESMNCADTFTAMREAGFINRAPHDIEEVDAICQRPFTREGMCHNLRTRAFVFVRKSC